jgi:hypothetical protein
VTYVPPNPRLDLVPVSTYPYRRDQSDNILVSYFALIQIKSHSLNFVVLTIRPFWTVQHNSREVPPGPTHGLDDVPDVVGLDTDRAAEDGGPEPADHAGGELPRRQGLPPSLPPLLLK